MDGLDLQKTRAVAVEIVWEAGELLSSQVHTRFELTPKGTDGDVLTSMDLAAERLIVSRLRDAFPVHQIMAEETGLSTAATEWCWLVDPLDGTNNVAIGLPLYAVGMALCYADVPVIGVIHEPVSGHTWSAVRGMGTVGANGEPLEPLAKPARHRPILGWIQGYSVTRDDQTANVLRDLVGGEARRVLELWAPLLCWVMLARGDIDGIVGYRIGALDLHAGVLIAEEAGIPVLDFDGNPFKERFAMVGEHRNVIAGKPQILERLLTHAGRVVNCVASQT